MWLGACYCNSGPQHHPSNEEITDLTGPFCACNTESVLVSSSSSQCPKLCLSVSYRTTTTWPCYTLPKQSCGQQEETGFSPSFTIPSASSWPSHIPGQDSNPREGWSETICQTTRCCPSHRRSLCSLLYLTPVTHSASIFLLDYPLFCFSVSTLTFLPPFLFSKLNSLINWIL